MGNSNDAQSLPERPALPSRCRLQWEEDRGEHVLLYPEGMLVLNETGHEILRRADGTRTLDELVEELEDQYESDDLRTEIVNFLSGVQEQGLLTDGANN